MRVKGRRDLAAACAVRRDRAYLEFCRSPRREHIAAGGRDKTVRVWDAETYQEVAKLDHGSQIYGLGFSPDNSRLATACGDDTGRLHR